MPEMAEPITVTRVYTGDDGETHLETLEVELPLHGVTGLSATVPVTGLILSAAARDVSVLPGKAWGEKSKAGWFITPPTS